MEQHRSDHHSWIGPFMPKVRWRGQRKQADGHFQYVTRGLPASMSLMAPAAFLLLHTSFYDTPLKMWEGSLLSFFCILVRKSPFLCDLDPTNLFMYGDWGHPSQHAKTRESPWNPRRTHLEYSCGCLSDCAATADLWHDWKHRFKG